MGRLFDPDWERAKKRRAAQRRESDRMLAANRALERKERATFWAAEQKHHEQRLSAISKAMQSEKDPAERQRLASEWNRQQAGAGPRRPPVAAEQARQHLGGRFAEEIAESDARRQRLAADIGVNRGFRDGALTGPSRSQSTTDAFQAAYAARDAKKAQAEARSKARPAPWEKGGSRSRRNISRAPDTDARRAVRERFKGQIVAAEAGMGKRARTARERRLLAEAQAKAARRASRTQITKLGGRDRLVETNKKAVLQKQLAVAAARGQKVSIMPRFSWLGKGKGSDGVVGQGDDEVRLWGRGWDAEKVVDRVMHPAPTDTYAPGDFNGFMEQSARRVGGVEGARGLLSVKMNIWSDPDPSEDDPDVEYPY